MDPRSGRGDLGDAREESRCPPEPPFTRVSPTTGAAGLHPEKRGPETAAGDSDGERPCHASLVLAGTGPRSGNHRGPEFLWVQEGTRHGRRDRAVSHHLEPEIRGAMGPRRRYPGLFRLGILILLSKTHVLELPSTELGETVQG